MNYLGAFLMALLATTSALYSRESLDPSFAEYSADFIQQINAMNTTWKAGANFAGETAASVLRRLGAAGFSPEKGPRLPVRVPKKVGVIPKEFNARKQWPSCPSIGQIFDQGRCNAFWVFPAVGSMRDRYCINFKKDFNFSFEDAVTCNSILPSGIGCGGGYTRATWKEWVNNGFVSGGTWNSSSGCRPYGYSPCDHYEKGTHGPCQAPPQGIICNKTCQNGFHKKYDDDKRKGVLAYGLAPSEVNIQSALLTGGPVSADITLFRDFLTYKSGVYQHKVGDFIGWTSVKIFGWGVENETKYWLCANSWNSEWGDKGFVKILRGSNECAIQYNVNAGIPK